MLLPLREKQIAELDAHFPKWCIVCEVEVYEHNFAYWWDTKPFETEIVCMDCWSELVRLIKTGAAKATLDETSNNE